MASAALIAGLGVAMSAASVGTQIAGQVEAENAADKQLAQSRKQEAQAKGDAQQSAKIAIGRAEAQAGASGITLGSFGSVFANMENDAGRNFRRLEDQFNLQRDSIRSERKNTRFQTAGTILGGVAGATQNALPLFADN
jgi:hypothetical protein